MQNRYDHALWYAPSEPAGAELLEGVVPGPPTDLVEEGRQLLADSIEMAVQAHGLCVRLAVLWDRITTQRPSAPAEMIDDDFADLWNYGTHSMGASEALAVAAKYIEDVVGGLAPEVPDSPNELRVAYASQLAGS